MAVFLTEKHELRLFSIKKKTEESRVTFFCHNCSHKFCFHISEELGQNRSDRVIESYPFEFDNDLEDCPQEELDDLISKQPYPCKIFIN
jgi:hypothetical protein